MSINTQFKEILENGGREVYSYSGRGMYGQNCIGFYVDGTIAQEIAQLATEIVNYCYDTLVGNDAEEMLDSIERLLDIMTEAKTDNMGQGTVIYFPNVEWEDVEEDEEESENENDEDDKDYD